MSRETRCLKVVWSLLQLACFVYARSESPGEVISTCRLVEAFATRRCNENYRLVCWPIYSINFSLRTIILIIIWIVKISKHCLSAYIQTSQSPCYPNLFEIPYSHNGLNAKTGIYIQVYKCKAFHRWKNTLCLTDFYMVMSRGVSLLRTAQSLLTGRTILLWVYVLVSRLMWSCLFVNGPISWLYARNLQVSYSKINNQRHVSWVLKRNVSLRLFF